MTVLSTWLYHSHSRQLWQTHQQNVWWQHKGKHQLNVVVEGEHNRHVTQFKCITDGRSQSRRDCRKRAALRQKEHEEEDEELLNMNTHLWTNENSLRNTYSFHSSNLCLWEVRLERLWLPVRAIKKLLTHSLTSSQDTSGILSTKPLDNWHGTLITNSGRL